jgi:hypothetical protein
MVRGEGAIKVPAIAAARKRRWAIFSEQSRVTSRKRQSLS